MLAHTAVAMQVDLAYPAVMRELSTWIICTRLLPVDVAIEFVLHQWGLPLGLLVGLLVGLFTTFILPDPWKSECKET